MTCPLRTTALLAAMPAFAAAMALTGPTLAGYAAPGSDALDTIRSKAVADSTVAARGLRGNVVAGYLSSWGLPPVPGHFSISDSALLFRSTEGTTTALGARFTLAYVDQEADGNHYVFRLEGAVFETDAPGALLDLASDPAWGSTARSASSTRRVSQTPDSDAIRAVQEITGSVYADTLYRLFGRPRATVGLIGPRGRAAGRLGEYIGRKDSLAFDPDRMTGQAQFRHALAHELAHRWQARAREQLAILWKGVPEIRDPKRYGYGELFEHQAEAAAFAVNFLQTTAGRHRAAATSLSLLDHYELLVPGTRMLVRFLALQSVYRNHPLRSLLTTAPVRYALEK